MYRLKKYCSIAKQINGGECNLTKRVLFCVGPRRGSLWSNMNLWRPPCYQIRKSIFHMKEYNNFRQIRVFIIYWPQKKHRNQRSCLGIIYNLAILPMKTICPLCPCRLANKKGWLTRNSTVSSSSEETIPQHIVIVMPVAAAASVPSSSTSTITYTEINIQWSLTSKKTKVDLGPIDFSTVMFQSTLVYR